MSIQVGNEYNGIPLGNDTGSDGGSGVSIEYVTELPNPGEEGVEYRVPVLDDQEQIIAYKEYYWIESESRYEEYGHIPADLVSWGSIQGTLSDQTDLNTVLGDKQDTLVSGTNIKTINSTSILGSGDLSVQESLVSGTNIKTINSNSLLGSGDLSVQESLVSGTNIKTINSNSVLGSGDISVQEPLVSGTNIKTINGTPLLGSGDISLQTGGSWGAISGNIEDQTDLANALADKQDVFISNVPLYMGRAMISPEITPTASDSYYTYSAGTNNDSSAITGRTATYVDGHPYNSINRIPFEFDKVYLLKGTYSTTTQLNSMLYTRLASYNQDLNKFVPVAGVITDYTDGSGYIQKIDLDADGDAVTNSTTNPTQSASYTFIGSNVTRLVSSSWVLLQKKRLTNGKIKLVCYHGFTISVGMYPDVASRLVIQDQTDNNEVTDLLERCTSIIAMNANSNSQNLYGSGDSAVYYYNFSGDLENVTDIAELGTRQQYTVGSPAVYGPYGLNVGYDKDTIVLDSNNNLSVDETALTGKQDALVSGTNIKTINGSSVLGSGDLTIATGGSWGSISGTLEDQTDLATVLAGKQEEFITNLPLKFSQEVISPEITPATSNSYYTYTSNPNVDISFVDYLTTISGSETVVPGEDFAHLNNVPFEFNKVYKLPGINWATYGGIKIMPYHRFAHYVEGLDKFVPVGVIGSDISVYEISADATGEIIQNTATSVTHDSTNYTTTSIINNGSYTLVQKVKLANSKIVLYVTYSVNRMGPPYNNYKYTVAVQDDPNDVNDSFTKFMNKCTHIMCTYSSNSSNNSDIHSSSQQSYGIGYYEYNNTLDNATSLSDLGTIQYYTVGSPEVLGPYGLNIGYDNSTIQVDTDNNLYVPKATSASLGVVKSDESTIHVDSTGNISTLNRVGSTDITDMVKCTQAAYDALVAGGTVDPHTFYIIVPATV